jgi:hypothetical protein
VRAQNHGDRDGVTASDESDVAGKSGAENVVPGSAASANAVSPNPCSGCAASANAFSHPHRLRRR